MATNTDRITALEKLAAANEAERASLEASVNRIFDQLAKHTEAISRIEARLPVLESQIADLRRMQESWNHRFWMLFSVMLAGLVTLVGNLIVVIAKT